jgi:hypothetical protein
MPKLFHHNNTDNHTAILLMKIGSGAHSDPEFSWRQGGVSCIDVREKRFQNTVPACVLLRRNFWNGIPSEKYPWLLV